MNARRSFTERRRARLARRVDTLDRLEHRSMITESLGLMIMGIGLPAQVAPVARTRSVGETGAPRKPAQLINRLPELVPAPTRSQVESSTTGGKDRTTEQAPHRPALARGEDWPTLRRRAGDVHGHEDLLVARKARPLQGGAGQTPRGGSGGTGNGQITSFRARPPVAGISSPSVVAGPSAIKPTAPPVMSAQRASVAAAAGTTGGTGGSAPTSSSTSGGTAVSGALSPTAGLFSVPKPGGGKIGPLMTFTYFPVYVLDNDSGVTLFPGFGQLATGNGSVDLRAQVRNTTVSTYSWDTSGAPDIAAGTVTGASTYNLQFSWNGSFGLTRVDSITLSVTDTNSHTQTATYSFFAIQNGPSSSNGTASWPQSLAPDTVLAGADSFRSHNVSVDANTGALDTEIDLPSYNPNVPQIVLTYDSQAASPQPIILANHTLDPTKTVPTQVSAQLTFNGTAGTTYYYNTSQFIPGDVQQLAQQANAASLATGRYNYTLTIGDIRSTTTTTTLNGSATVLNDGSSTIGAGWTVAGLEQITSASGGVILDLGGHGRSLWFAGSFGSGGGTFTDPHGEFSTLTQNSGGGYTRTLTDGTQILFNSGGQQIATVDTNGLRTTYSYSGGALSSIQDPYGKLTTFTYSGGELSTITDPASRIATFTHSGSNLTGVTLPDSGIWGYGYSGGRMTTVTDPNSHTVSIAYDSAARASTITRPDNTVETFRAYQESGWTNTGTSLSPAAATLLAEATANYTDPLNNQTQLLMDWNGEGLTNTAVDASGNVSTNDRDINGLATVAIDRDNRVTQKTYDSLGNPVTITYPAGNTDHYTYNSFSEPLTHTDGNGNTTSYTYDAHGNNTVVQDPLLNLTTMTYTTDGMLATFKDARNNVTSEFYDTQDRLTTIQFPDGSTNLFGYDSKGNQTAVTDGNSHTTTFSFDPMNRETGTTDALGNPTTYVYDSGGRMTAVQAPLSRTTSYVYDAMDRVTTTTDPLGHSTVGTYDSGGNLLSVKDPLGRITTYSYDPENRLTVVQDPMGRLTTTSYDAASQVTSVRDPLSDNTQYTYTSNGWLSTMVDPLSRVSTYTHSKTGQLLLQTDPATSGGTLYSYTYDKNDQLLTVTDGNNHTTTFTYDAVGNRIAVTDADNNTTSLTYDSLNRLTTVTDALGHATVYGFDSGGNQITVKDALGNVVTTQFDPVNRATTLIDARGDQTATQLDAAGRVSVVIDPTGNRTSYSYDAADRLTALTTPLGTTTYVYDISNELTDQTDANGRRTTFAYDPDRELTAERWLTSSGGTVRTISYTYDNTGKLTGASDPDATLTFTYDSGGNQLTAETSGSAGQPDVKLTSTYTPDNLRTSVADNLSSATTVSFQYDIANRLTTITQSIGGPPIVFGYDPAGNVTSITRNKTVGTNPTYVSTSMAYDAAERLTTITDQAAVFTSGGSGGGSYSTTPLATYIYGYDNANRVTSEQNAEGTVSYSYDNANELTGASGSRAETYTYDSGGNRTMSSYTTGTDNELTASPGYTYTYDAEGNLTGKTQTSTGSVWTFSFDYRNRLTGATERNSGGTTIFQATYTYDPLNRRIETNVNGTPTWTVYDGTKPWADFSGGGSGGATLKDHYLYGPAVDELLGRTDSGGNTAWYLTDKNGTVRDIVDTSGNALDHIVYDSYGNVTSESNSSNGDRFKFQAMQLDAGTGLYFDNARYYDPTGGRFVGQDPISFAAGQSNLYVFVGNGPTDAIDPTGLQQLGQPFGPQGGGGVSVVPNVQGPGPGQMPAQPQSKFCVLPNLTPADVANKTQAQLKELERIYSEEKKDHDEMARDAWERTKFYLEQTAIKIKLNFAEGEALTLGSFHRFLLKIWGVDRARAAEQDFGVWAANKAASEELKKSIALLRLRQVQQILGDDNGQQDAKAKGDQQKGNATRSKPQ